MDTWAAVTRNLVSFGLASVGLIVASADQKSAYAFSYKIVDDARREREEHCSHQSSFRCQVTLGAGQTEKNVLKFFSEAVREFALISNQIYHCSIFPELFDTYGQGRTVCPCQGSPFKQYGNVKIMVSGKSWQSASWIYTSNFRQETRILVRKACQYLPAVVAVMASPGFARSTL
jgi:hypothetical protein